MYNLLHFFLVISSADITQMRTGPGAWGFQRRLAPDWLPSFGISALQNQKVFSKAYFMFMHHKSI
jgi:hypothetical protein